MKFIVSCEHASNALPEKYKYLKSDNESIWKSHRGFDIGAYSLFLELKNIADSNFEYEYSRLLIEPNRSLHHRNLFSEFSRNLEAAEKRDLIENYYLKYRNEVEKCIEEYIRVGETVFHISAHSFTPNLNGVERNTEIGLLYDPSRDLEKLMAKSLKSQFVINNNFRVRFNYPYLGIADGFTTYLRKKFKKNYIGIELEVNQKLATKNIFSKSLLTSFKEALTVSIDLYKRGGYL
ncbi:N-formylglutamate amidohydrolase [Zunongwangia sp.]|uniref:N-formylglutamate amidohydrolase n=1 Tax=Zunongwangia sp. TaxID=1965325 RepID=UPI003AA7BEDB